MSVRKLPRGVSKGTEGVVLEVSLWNGSATVDFGHGETLSGLKEAEDVARLSPG